MISDVMPVSEVVDGGVDDDEDLVVAVNLKIIVNKLHICNPVASDLTFGSIKKF